MSKKENDSIRFLEGVYVSEKAREKFEDFEKNYLLVREKEKRVLSLEEIKQLPFPAKESSDFELWKIRRKNSLRFQNYLSKKEAGLRLLDIGCGNGFFTNLLSHPANTVVGVDVNFTELKQAALAFPTNKITWYYLDLLHENLPEEHFDIITFNASFQYFKDPAALLTICKSLLNKNGEIHILDSPFYKEGLQKEACKRSEAYYNSMGVEKMSDYYYHNSYSALDKFTFRLNYDPDKFLNKLRKDSPFPWIVIS